MSLTIFLTIILGLLVTSLVSIRNREKKFRLTLDAMEIIIQASEELLVSEPPKDSGRNKLKPYRDTIKIMLDSGLSRKEIAGQFGVTRQAVDYFIKHHLQENR